MNTHYDAATSDKILSTSTKKWAVIAAYDGPFGDRGTIVSKHKSYEIALRTCSKYVGGWLKVRELYNPSTNQT